MIKRIYVLFDAECGLCRRCREWIQAQPAYFEFVFISYQDTEIENLFPGIRSLSPEKQLLVVSDEGAIYQGPRAWIMCLYGLIDYREWALRLAQPAVMPFAKYVVTGISANRRRLSHLLGQRKNDDIVRTLSIPETESESCSNSGTCSL